MIQKKNIKDKVKNYIKFFLGIPLTVVSLFFIFSFIFTSRDEVFSYVGRFNLFAFVAGIIFLLLFFSFRSLVWKKMLSNEGYSVKTNEAFYLLSSSEIKRYVPGSILSFMSRVTNFNKLKIPKKTLVKLIFYESIIFIISSAVVSIPGVFFMSKNAFSVEKFSNIATAVLFVLILGLILLFLVSLKHFKKIFTKVFSQAAIHKEALFIMGIAWVFFGIGNYLLSASFLYLDPYNFIAVSSFFVLSWLLGYATVVTPLGLGVREGVVIYGLSPFLSIPVASALAVILRVFLTASELLFLGLSLVFNRYVKLKFKISLHLLILWASIASYITYFSYVSFEKHLNFFTGRFDLGNMDQTVWNTIHGRIFELTNPNSIETVSRLGIHADFFLILLAPFYLIWEDPRMLLFIQSFIIGIGAYYVYKISEFIIKDKTLSLVFAISFLLNPFVQKQNLFDFHAVALGTTFLIAAFYYSLVRKYKYFLFFILLSVLTKENVYIISFLFGIYLFIKTKNTRWLILSTVSFIVFYLLISKFMPDARGGAHFASEYFQDFGDSPTEIIKNIFLNPFKTASELLQASSIAYFYKILLPVGFLSIFSPLFLIFVGPEFLVNLLSKNENLRSLTFHYGAVIIPFVYISSIYGAKKILSLKIKYLNPALLTILILITSLIATFEYGTLPGAKNPSVEIYTDYLKERSEIKKFIDGIPSELSVVSSNNLGAHVSEREKLYTLPSGVKQADVILFLLNDVYAQPSLESQKEMVRELSSDPGYIEVYRLGDFVAFAKRASAIFLKSP